MDFIVMTVPMFFSGINNWRCFMVFKCVMGNFAVGDFALKFGDESIQETLRIVRVNI